MVTHKKKTSLRFLLTAIVTVLLVDQWMKSIELCFLFFLPLILSFKTREKSEQTLLSTTIRLEQTF